MNKKGFLVVNAFLHSHKFTEIYEWLEAAATKAGLELDVYTNAEEIPDGYDFCLFWDKDIPLARILEKKGIRVFNSSEAIRICDDKYATYEALLDADIDMPYTVSVPMTYENIGFTDFMFVKEKLSRFSYPVIIKECHGSFGAQVYLANDEKEACSILGNIGGKPAIFQEFLPECRGRDIRINMVGENAVCAMERYNEADFRANITGGGKMRPHEVTEEELILARKVMKALKLDFAGVDILLAKRGPLLCEVNSNAHFKNIYDCTGVNVAEHIIEYIKQRI